MAGGKMHSQCFLLIVSLLMVGLMLATIIAHISYSPLYNNARSTKVPVVLPDTSWTKFGGSSLKWRSPQIYLNEHKQPATLSPPALSISELLTVRNVFTDPRCCVVENDACWKGLEPIDREYLRRQTHKDGGWTYSVPQAPVGCVGRERNLAQLNTTVFSHHEMYSSLEGCIPWLREQPNFDSPLCDRYILPGSPGFLAAASTEHDADRDDDNNSTLKSLIVHDPWAPLMFHTIWATDHPPHQQLLLLLKSIIVVHLNARVRVHINLWLYQPGTQSPSVEAWVQQAIQSDREWAVLLSRLEIVSIKKALLDHLSRETRLHEWTHKLTLGTWHISDLTHSTDSDLLRLLILYRYGGVYVDADVLVLRSFAHLAEQEFLYQWGIECHRANGAVMHFTKRSDALDVLFVYILAQWPAHSVAQNGPRGSSLATDLYNSVFFSTDYRLRAMPSLQQHQINKVAPLLLPSCFMNPNWHATDIKYTSDEFASQWNGPFAFHLHGSIWRAKIEEDSDYSQIRVEIQAAYAQLTQ